MDRIKQETTVDPFSQSVNELCDVVLLKEKLNYQSKLQPFEAYAARLRNEISSSLNSYQHSFKDGYRLVLDQIANKKSVEEQEKYHIPGKAEKTAKTPDDFFDAMEQKQVLQAVFDYSGQMMSEVYELGVRLRRDKRQGESAAIFIFLITLNPYVCSFWQGLGKAWHEQSRFEEALSAYSVSIDCDPYRMGSYRDAVRCCLDHKNYEAALLVLDHGLKAVQVSADEENLKDFKRNIEAMQAYVESVKTGE